MRFLVTITLLALSIFIKTFACTNLIAVKLATVDGSTMITYSADS